MLELWGWNKPRRLRGLLNRAIKAVTCSDFDLTIISFRLFAGQEEVNPIGTLVPTIWVPGVRINSGAWAILGPGSVILRIAFAFKDVGKLSPTFPARGIGSLSLGRN